MNGTEPRPPAMLIPRPTPRPRIIRTTDWVTDGVETDIRLALKSDDRALVIEDC